MSSRPPACCLSSRKHEPHRTKPGLECGAEPTCSMAIGCCLSVSTEQKQEATAAEPAPTQTMLVMSLLTVMVEFVVMIMSTFRPRDKTCHGCCCCQTLICLAYCDHAPQLVTFLLNMNKRKLFISWLQEPQLGTLLIVCFGFKKERPQGRGAELSFQSSSAAHLNSRTAPNLWSFFVLGVHF